MPPTNVTCAICREMLEALKNIRAYAEDPEGFGVQRRLAAIDMTVREILAKVEGR